MFGTSAAIAYAFTAGLTKVVADYAAADWATLYQHWETYGLAVFGVLAVFLTQNAYLAGPIAASQSTIVLVDPLVSIFLGVFLFGDDLRTACPGARWRRSPWWSCSEGPLLLCQSPLVTGVKGEVWGARPAPPSPPRPQGGRRRRRPEHPAGSGGLSAAGLGAAGLRPAQCPSTAARALSRSGWAKR